MTNIPDETPQIDIAVPHLARIWDYWLGGEDNYPTDQAATEKIKRIFPEIEIMVRDSRAFLGRAVRCLAVEYGIGQFLDLGAGPPTADSTHQVAQRVDPAARVVYVDNDPIVLSHAQALPTCAPSGMCQYIDADLADPWRVLEEAEHTLHLRQPIAVILASVLPHIADDADAAWVVQQYMDAVPPGSALVFCHDVPHPRLVEAARELVAQGCPVVKPRTYEQMVRLLPDGLRVVKPGITATWAWRSQADAPRRDKTLQYAGVAIKEGGAR